MKELFFDWAILILVIVLLFQDKALEGIALLLLNRIDRNTR